MKKQVRAYYIGKVQGVGFRFTAQDLANELGVAGWVKNLSNGRVEIKAEAEEAILKDFLKKIFDYFSRYIQDVEVKWLNATGEYKDFRVEF